LNKKGVKVKTVKYSIPAMMCQHCVHTIEGELSELEGVKSVKAALDEKSVDVSFDAPASEEKIIDLLKEINYPPKTG
jgi:copper chaperone